MQKQSLVLTSKLNKLLENTGDMALKRRAKMIVESLDIKKGDIILEVGCGDGFYLHLLSNLNLSINLTGVDIDKQALASARKNVLDKKVKLFHADLMKKLPFKSKSFDKIIMSEVAEHLPNDVKGLIEVKRVLRPGGMLVLTVPNANYPLLWDPINWICEHIFGFHFKSGFWSGIWNQHRRLYTDEGIKKVVKKAGFTVVSAKPITFWSLPFNHNIINLGARILASKTISSKITQGANKFSKKSDKSLPVKALFYVSELTDRMNDVWTPRSSGVCMFVKAIK